MEGNKCLVALKRFYIHIDFILSSHFIEQEILPFYILEGSDISPVQYKKGGSINFTFFCIVTITGSQEAEDWAHVGGEGWTYEHFKGMPMPPICATYRSMTEICCILRFFSRHPTCSPVNPFA